jgi:hypothetical protein
MKVPSHVSEELTLLDAAQNDRTLGGKRPPLGEVQRHLRVFWGAVLKFRRSGDNPELPEVLRKQVPPRSHEPPVLEGRDPSLFDVAHHAVAMGETILCYVEVSRKGGGLRFNGLPYAMVDIKPVLAKGIVIIQFFRGC